MCGIAGTFDWGAGRDADRARVENMIRVLAHRGPDGSGVMCDGPIALGSCRLAIVDLEHGDQPLSYEGERYWITYNGELFNHDELRHELESRGRTFRSRCDTEVVVAAFAEYGDDCVNRFNGQFCFAIWDAKRQRLFIARDRMGIIPLVYSNEQGRFTFASEAKAIIAAQGGNASVNYLGVADALLFSAQVHDETLFRNIHSLPPGHVLAVDAKGLELHQYWSLENVLRRDMRDADPKEVGERFWSLLGESVQMRLMGDVAVGTLLSGGMDSSTVLKLATQEAKRGPSFTIDFPNPFFGKDRDLEYARLMAAHLSATLHEVHASAEDYFDVLEQVVWHLERPFNKGAVSMYLLYRDVGKHVKVVLCGEGADELFAGYLGSSGLGLDDILRTGTVNGIPWAPHANLMLDLFSDDYHRQHRPREHYASTMEAVKNKFTGNDPMNCGLALYLRYFLLELLEIHDLTGMAFHVEARPPFLDHRIVELLAPLPSEQKHDNREGKRLFKGLLRGFIPDEVLDRRKTHLPIPRDPKTVLRQLETAKSLLLSPDARTRPWFDANRLGMFLDRREMYADVPAVGVWQLSMYLITLEMLLRRNRMTA